MNNKTKAHLAVFGTSLFFAANNTLVKLISPAYIKPFALNIFRVGFNLLLFWLAWSFGKTAAGIKKQHIGRFILCGITGIAIIQTFFIKGLTLTTSIHASLLILATPLLITIIAFWVLKEKVTLIKIFGLLLGISGSLLLIAAKEKTAHAENYLLGDLLILINAISYAVYFILVKPLMEAYSPLHVVRWVFTIGFLLLLPIGWVQVQEINWQQVELVHYASLTAVIITGTFLAYYFTAFGIQLIGASTTGSYIYTQPVFAVLIATIVLSEILTLQKVVAACLIFEGVFLLSYKKRLYTTKIKT